MTIGTFARFSSFAASSFVITFALLFSNPAYAIDSQTNVTLKVSAKAANQLADEIGKLSGTQNQCGTAPSARKTASLKTAREFIPPRSLDGTIKYVWDANDTLWQIANGQWCEIATGVADVKMAAHPYDPVAIYFLTKDGGAYSKQPNLCHLSHDVHLISSNVIKIGVIDKADSPLAFLIHTKDKAVIGWGPTGKLMVNGYARRGPIKFPNVSKVTINPNYLVESAPYSSYMLFFQDSQKNIYKMKGSTFELVQESDVHSMDKLMKKVNANGPVVQSNKVKQPVYSCHCRLKDQAWEQVFSAFVPASSKKEAMKKSKAACLLTARDTNPSLSDSSYIYVHSCSET